MKELALTKGRFPLNGLYYYNISINNTKSMNTKYNISIIIHSQHGSSFSFSIDTSFLLYSIHKTVNVNIFFSKGLDPSNVSSLKFE